jgi:hypothetical protein
VVSEPADPASSGTGPLSPLSPQAGLPTAASRFPAVAGAAYIYSYDSDGDPVLIDADADCQPGSGGVFPDGPGALHPPSGGAKSRQAWESPGARE